MSIFKLENPLNYITKHLFSSKTNNSAELLQNEISTKLESFNLQEGGEQRSVGDIVEYKVNKIIFEIAFISFSF